MCINHSLRGPLYTKHFGIIGQLVWPVKAICKSLPLQIVAREEYVSIGKIFPQSFNWKKLKHDISCG